MSDNILVIGNGFDIAHGRKTKYSDFLEWICYPSNDLVNNHPDLLVSNKFPFYKNSSIMTYIISCYDNKSRINSWIDLELELKVFVKNVDDLLDGLNRIEYTSLNSAFLVRTRSVKISDAFLVSQLVSIFDPEPPDVKIKKIFVDTWRKIDKQKVYETLKDELIQLRQMLEFYLISVEPLLCGKIELKDEISSINPGYVISFNYTDTIQKYYGVKDNDICYVHGKINENNIVLGYDDSDGNTTDLCFKKYYQRLIYNTGNIDFKRLYHLNSYGGRENNTIYFFGHSLDVSDKDLLVKLFVNRNPIRIFYLDSDDKNRKIENIISIIGKDQAISKIERKEIEFYTSSNKGTKKS